MKKLLVILILFSVMVTAGCSMSNHPPDCIKKDWNSASLAVHHFSMPHRPTLVDSAEERDFRMGQIDNFQSRMFTDDWDRIWLRNSSSKLSYWTPQVGF